MTDTIKLGEISKKIKITNKEIIAKLAEFGIECKSAASVITEEQASLIFDIYTQLHEESEEDIIAAREEALQAKAKALQKEEKAEEVKEETTAPKEEKPAEKSVKEEKKAPAKKESAPKEEKKPAEQPKKEEKKKHYNQAKKQTGHKIDLSNIDRTNTEAEYVVTAEEHKRVVDTRTSNVDLDKIASSERIEDMVPDNINVQEHGRNRNKKGKNNFHQENIQKKKQEKISCFFN